MRVCFIWLMSRLKLDFWCALKLKINGKIFVGYAKREGWTGKLPWLRLSSPKALGQHVKTALRIGIVVGCTYPVIGGTELASFKVAKKLVEQGHEVVMVTRFSEGFGANVIEQMNKYDEYMDGKLKIYRAGVLPIMVGRFLSHTFKAFTVMWKNPPDLIIAFTLMPYGFSAMIVRYLLALTRLKSVPVIVWGRGNDIFITPKRKDLVGWLTRRLLGIVFRAKVVLAQSPAMKEEFIKYGCKKEKIRVIGNAIDVERYTKIPRKPVRNTVIFVGAARPEKGLSYLISAINRIPQAKLIVVGGWGEEEKTCKDLAGGNATFVGKAKPEEVPNYLAKAEIFCQPSLSEGFPNSTLEAMAMGLPIIASNVGGLPYILGEAGILVPPKDVDALEKAINHLLSDEDLRRQLSSLSLERVKRFSWSVVMDKLMGVIKEVLE